MTFLVKGSFYRTCILLQKLTSLMIEYSNLQIRIFACSQRREQIKG
jgi:hypothetical protein